MASQDTSYAGMAAKTDKQTARSQHHQHRSKAWLKCPEQRETVPGSYAETKKPSLEGDG